MKQNVKNKNEQRIEGFLYRHKRAIIGAVSLIFLVFLWMAGHKVWIVLSAPSWVIHDNDIDEKRLQKKKNIVVVAPDYRCVEDADRVSRPFKCYRKNQETGKWHLEATY